MYSILTIKYRKIGATIFARKIEMFWSDIWRNEKFSLTLVTET